MSVANKLFHLAPLSHCIVVAGAIVSLIWTNEEPAPVSIKNLFAFETIANPVYNEH